MGIQNLTEQLDYSCENGIATLTFNRPDSLNACTTAMYHGIIQVVEEVRHNDEAKVLIITGAGEGFCAGSDAKERLEARARGESLAKSRRETVAPVGYFGAALYGLEKPTIAAVNGICVGAGLSFALLCDIRIASDKARFGAVWVRMGLVPDVGATYLLPRTIGTDKALELCYTGQIIDATEAMRIGLVTRVAPHDTLIATAHELALRIAEGPSAAIELAKRGIYRAIGGDYSASLEYESFAQMVCFQTEDFKEALSAFKEKRKAKFQGK